MQYRLTLNVSHALAPRAKTDADSVLYTLRCMIENSGHDVRSARTAKVAEGVHTVSLTYVAEGDLQAAATARVALVEIRESHDSVDLRTAHSRAAVAL